MLNVKTKYQVDLHKNSKILNLQFLNYFKNFSYFHKKERKEKKKKNIHNLSFRILRKFLVIKVTNL